MIDPPRLREAGTDAPSELKDLFRDAQKPTALAPATDQRVLAQITALGAPPSAAPLVKMAPWLTAGGLVVVAGALLLTSRDRAPGPPSTPTAPSAVVPLAPSSSAPVAVTAPQSSAELKQPVSAELKQPASAPSAAPAVRAEAGNPAVRDALADEARLLNEAHIAMATDPQTALTIVSEHAKRYPRGQLAAERELIRVQALVKLGRVREAEARARALRKSAPSTIYGERLDNILKGR